MFSFYTPPNTGVSYGDTATTSDSSVLSSAKGFADYLAHRAATQPAITTPNAGALVGVSP